MGAVLPSARLVMLRDLYWWLWRFYHSWVSPHRWFRRLRVFWQRGTRGFSDEDTWSFDDYLTMVIVQGVNRLRQSKIGYPAGLLDDSACAMGQVLDDEDAANMAKWHGILDQIVRGFCARQMLTNLDQYTFENGEPHLNEALQARLEAERDEGMKLFVTWFDALWD